MIENFLDIGLLLVITGFVILKLYNVLGQDDTSRFKDKNMTNMVSSNNVVSMLKSQEKIAVDQPHFPPYVKSILIRINSCDSSFSEDYFLKAAKKVFEMIFVAYDSHDDKTLQGLVNDEVYKELAENLAMKATQDKITERELLAITSVEIIDAKLAGSKASIKVKFCSIQRNRLLDLNKQIINDFGQTINLEDIWMFSRDVSSSNPEWLLTAINC